jgi:hypothetical protein
MSPVCSVSRPCPPLAYPRPSPHTHPPRKHTHTPRHRSINQSSAPRVASAMLTRRPSLMSVHVYLMSLCLSVNMSMCVPVYVTVRLLCPPPRPPPLCLPLRGPMCPSWPTPHTSSSHYSYNSQVLPHHSYNTLSDTHSTHTHMHTHAHTCPQTSTLLS